MINNNKNENNELTLRDIFDKFLWLYYDEANQDNENSIFNSFCTNYKNIKDNEFKICRFLPTKERTSNYILSFLTSWDENIEDDKNDRMAARSKAIINGSLIGNKGKDLLYPDKNFYVFFNNTFNQNHEHIYNNICSSLINDSKGLGRLKHIFEEKKDFLYSKEDIKAGEKKYIEKISNYLMGLLKGSEIDEKDKILKKYISEMGIDFVWIDKYHSKENNLLYICKLINCLVFKCLYEMYERKADSRIKKEYSNLDYSLLDEYIRINDINVKDSLIYDYDSKWETNPFFSDDFYNEFGTYQEDNIRRIENGLSIEPGIINVLYGNPGIGKTSLIRYLLYRAVKEREDKKIKIHIKGKNKDDISLRYVITTQCKDDYGNKSIKKAIADLAGSPDTNLETRYRNNIRLLEKVKSNCLLVIDNYKDYESIAELKENSQVLKDLKSTGVYIIIICNPNLAKFNNLNRIEIKTIDYQNLYHIFCDISERNFTEKEKDYIIKKIENDLFSNTQSVVLVASLLKELSKNKKYEIKKFFDLLLNQSSDEIKSKSIDGSQNIYFRHKEILEKYLKLSNVKDNWPLLLNVAMIPANGISYKQFLKMIGNDTTNREGLDYLIDLNLIKKIGANTSIDRQKLYVHQLMRKSIIDLFNSNSIGLSCRKDYFRDVINYVFSNYVGDTVDGDSSVWYSILEHIYNLFGMDELISTQKKDRKNIKVSDIEYYEFDFLDLKLLSFLTQYDGFARREENTYRSLLLIKALYSINYDELISENDKYDYVKIAANVAADYFNSLPANKKENIKEIKRIVELIKTLDQRLKEDFIDNKDSGRQERAKKLHNIIMSNIVTLSIDESNFEESIKQLMKIVDEYSDEEDKYFMQYKIGRCYEKRWKDSHKKEYLEKAFKQYQEAIDNINELYDNDLARFIATRNSYSYIATKCLENKRNKKEIGKKVLEEIEKCISFYEKNENLLEGIEAKNTVANFSNITKYLDINNTEVVKIKRRLIDLGLLDN